MRPSRARIDPLEPFLDRQGVVILDGGLATELEERGCDLDNDLWSARVLADQPDRIEQLHLDYLRAGSDCIIGASYQATIAGFVANDIRPEDAMRLLVRSVEIACRARDEFWSVAENRRGRLRPLVAASVGPYGAYLADGSEFRGDYGLDKSALVDFHRPRWQILATAGADLLACETIPSGVEGEALAELVATTPSVPVWMSFSCRDDSRLNDGSAVAEVVSTLDRVQEIIAFGVNCTAPRFIAGLITNMRTATSRPLIVYPNSGESWDAESHRWVPDGSATRSLAMGAREWRRLGARGIGGCCRTGPQDIARLRQVLLGSDLVNDSG